MAISDEIKHQRKRLKGKGWKAYLQYFWDYYKWYVVGVVVAAVFIGSLVTTLINRKDQALGVIMLNASVNTIGTDDLATSIEEGFAAYVGLDTDSEEIVVDTSSYQTPGTVQDEYDMSASQKVSVQSAAQTLDVVVADASNYYYYTCALAFNDLREVLTEDQLAQYQDRIYYVDMADIDAYQAEVESAASTDGPMTAEEGAAYEVLSTWTNPDPDTMENPIPVGIIVTDAPVIANSGAYTDTVVICGFVQSSNAQEMAVNFLEYLFEG